MPYVYILYEYSEYGAETLGATLDRSLLNELIDHTWPLVGPSVYHPEGRDASEQQHIADWRDCQRSRLANVLQHTDAELAKPKDGWDISNGWGGMKLHVVMLYEKG